MIYIWLINMKIIITIINEIWEGEHWARKRSRDRSSYPGLFLTLRPQLSPLLRAVWVASLGSLRCIEMSLSIVGKTCNMDIMYQDSTFSLIVLHYWCTHYLFVSFSLRCRGWVLHFWRCILKYRVNFWWFSFLSFLFTPELGVFV